MEEGDYKLFLNQYPTDGKFARVHAILLMPDGRVLLRYKGGETRITGGHIDTEDVDLLVALRREIREELNCEIDKVDYLGYLKATNGDTRGCEYWARMVARVAKIGEAKPDPDRGGAWTYGRRLVPPEIAKSEMGKSVIFGKNNVKLLEAALRMAQERGYFTESLSREVEVLNDESLDELS